MYMLLINLMVQILELNGHGKTALINSEAVLNVPIFIATLLMALPVIMESLNEKQILIEANPKAKNK